ncbi:MAG TPA: tetratricopeptide repeat protein, partial [Rhodospirillales bacterium]|nr:tetratricopeptide repeat protein [Rhodospirillales bacterium]
MNRNERRRLAKQNKKNKSAHGATRPVSNAVLSILEKALQFQSDGQLGEAEILYRQVLAQDPDNGFANHLLGLVMLQKGDSRAAVDLLQKALTQDPDNPQKQAILADALIALGKLAQADQTLQKLLQTHPNHANALANMGNIRLVTGHYQQADDYYGKSLAISPENFVNQCNRGNALFSLEKIEAAKECFTRALGLNPDYTDALKNLANALMSEGDLDQAAHVYDQAITLQPADTGLRINRAMLLPVIPKSVNEIKHYRDEMVKNLDALMAQEGNFGNLGEPSIEAGVTGFYLAYGALNDVPVVCKITEMYAKLCPRLTWTADHCQPESEAERSEKYRIGFLSHHFHNHTIGKLNRGFIEHFDRNRFDVIVFRTGSIDDSGSQAIEKAADKVVHLPENLDAAQRLVAHERLDLLFYPDTGMDAFTYYLAYARLAPVQVTSWGHPISTGIANMDYYVSSHDLETDRGDDHYRETLVRLKYPPTCYARPEKVDLTLNRADFGLPEGANLYLCPQTLFKFHPDYDRVLGDILAADPQGRIVIISGRYANKQRLLTERFAKAFPDQVDRVLFVPRMNLEQFMQLILIADVILDPMFFGGGNSSAEAISAGAPIVTLAGEYLRDRVTYAFYKTMG